MEARPRLSRVEVLAGHIVAPHVISSPLHYNPCNSTIPGYSPHPLSEKILTKKFASSGCLEIVLNRPSALNSLTMDMFAALHAILDESAMDNSIHAVLVTGGKKGFCAGGDLKHFISETGRWHFATCEYALDRKIHRTPVPYIAIMDGVTMGGGVGVSIHGRYRIVTDKIVWAMPEVTVGFLADVGSTYFLSRCPGNTGLYLALTGVKISASDAMFIGVGTHFVTSHNVPLLCDALHKRDISTSFKIEQILLEYSSMPDMSGDCILQDNIGAINRCFNAKSVEEIIQKLEKENTQWAQNTINILLHNCPTSLKVVFEAIKRAKNMTLEEALRMELRAGIRLVQRQDIQEGVKTVLVDKARGIRPAWNPAHIELVEHDFVSSFFLPFENYSAELDFK